jgi:phenylpropionate dioxygenase-like ring-hydroxylating dioxygenase large terminal subunit
MVSSEVNDLLARVGPGTPAGDLMRRYWQPVALAEELPRDGAPIPIRLLGEDLVLFRDESGRPGLLGLFCAHRGADLSYGRVENGGLRCIYHGWLYNIQGRCLEQPGEPPRARFHDRIRHTAYPCIERADAIFAYLGPGDPPLLPGFDFLTAPEGHVVAHKLLSECNYLQGNEGNIDSNHLPFVHRVMANTGPGHSEHCWYDTVETEKTDHGIRVFWVRELPDTTFVHTNVFLMPNLTAIMGGATGNGYSINWHVPIDDTHHWKYTFQYRAHEVMDKDRARAGRTPMTPDYRPVPNRANRYLQDRTLMEDVVFSGIPNQYFQAQDLCVTEGQPILDRTQEHLGYGDQPIMAARSMLLQAIKDVREGLDPPGVIRDPAANDIPIIMRATTVPAGTDWRACWPDGVPT